MAARGGARSTRRRRGGGGVDDSQRWLGTYADMVTLLMAFFVMLYAMSELDVAKFAAFVEGLAVPFGNVSSDALLPESDGIQPETDGMQPEESPPATERIEPIVPPEQVLADAARRAAEQDQLDEVAAAVQAALVEAKLDHLVEQRREERGLIVSVASDDVLFALGSTEVSRLGRRVIDTVASALDGFPNPMLVEGHTDDLPLRRSGYTNWNLSTDRAVAVLQLMLEEHGLPPDRVAAAGYGEHRPLNENRGTTSRARNRRVDIAVLIEENLR